jgi:hypothetical protein
MSFDNNLLTEVKGIEYVVDLAIVSRTWFSPPDWPIIQPE